ncbi:hypothetical protein GBAR_LOCUS14176 [Geodia barretti]|uniref:Uncharacterized protein n=1 Tax=Geodia barretti TaxID=519541 RepID=A0AA35WL47_GEOBA|nr:hypothetical protein GBAR_LOCUS14176 [Geodia barretti]
MMTVNSEVVTGSGDPTKLWERGSNMTGRWEGLCNMVVSSVARLKILSHHHHSSSPCSHASSCTTRSPLPSLLQCCPTESLLQ